MGSIDLPYINSFLDRYGVRRYFYRRGGRRVPLGTNPKDPEFHRLYWTARNTDDGVKEKAKNPARERRDLNALAQKFFTTTDFLNTTATTKRAYKSNLKPFLSTYGHLGVSGLQYQHMLVIMQSMSDRPGAANNVLKRLKAMWKIARALKWTTHDPFELIKPFKLGSIETWPADDLTKFVKHHKPGTMARLAFLTHLHTGQRRSDAFMLRMPRKQSDGFSFAQQKTSRDLFLPVADPLWEEIQLHDNRMILLHTSYGKPFASAAAYGNWFKDQCEAAGLSERNSHGIRKAAAKDLAEAGCSTHEIMSITGHTTLKEVERYTRDANQKRLAEQAIEKRSKNK